MRLALPLVYHKHKWREVQSLIVGGNESGVNLICRRSLKVEDDITDAEIPVRRAISSEASRETTRGANHWKLLLLRTARQGET